MLIETLMEAGEIIAMNAMRNPYESWNRGDSIMYDGKSYLGEADRTLATKLHNAGSEHAKHLRMIIVWARIQAPRYWWMQFDTYRVGVEKISTSTMHTLMKHKLTADDFEGKTLRGVIDLLNTWIDEYKECDDPERRKQLEMYVIQNLPQSYIQERTVMMSYAAIRNIYKQRAGHKLREWQMFRDWASQLPYAWMICD